MKENTINIRTDEQGEADLKKAAENLSVMTDERPSISKAIRAGVKILAETDPSKPELFYIDRSALQDVQRNLEYGRDKLASIIRTYQDILGDTPTLPEIESWFGADRSNYLVTNKALIRESIVLKMYNEERAKCQKLGLKIQLTTDNVILPDLDPLLEECGQLIFIPEINRREEMLWQCFAIDSDASVDVVPEEVEAVKNRYRVYACTSEERARLSVMRKLCEAMNAVKISTPSQLNIPGFVVWDPEAGVYGPAEQWVKGYLK